MEDTALGLLARRERLWPAALASLALHAALLTLAALNRPAPIVDLEQKPIVARLVRLGEKRPEVYLPRKEELPPEPPAAAVPIPTPAAPPAPASPAKGPATATPRRDPLANALERIKRQTALSEPTWGDPSGDPEGTSAEANEGDRYLALVTRALQANYRLPSTLSESERLYLRATVVLVVEPDGSISSYRFERRSGNASFDDALDRAIRQTRLPPPPAELRLRYRTVGLGVNWHM